MTTTEPPKQGQIPELTLALSVRSGAFLSAWKTLPLYLKFPFGKPATTVEGGVG